MRGTATERRALYADLCLGAYDMLCDIYDEVEDYVVEHLNDTELTFYVAREDADNASNEANPDTDPQVGMRKLDGRK